MQPDASRWWLLGQKASLTGPVMLEVVTVVGEVANTR
jgi:hypothetical protein